MGWEWNPAGTFHLFDLCCGLHRCHPSTASTQAKGRPHQPCEAALRAWSVGHEEPPPLATDHSRQKAWDTPRLKPLSKQSKQQPQMPLREPVSLRPAGRSQGHGFTPCQCQRWGCAWTTSSCAWLWDCAWVSLYAIHMNAISVEQE